MNYVALASMLKLPDGVKVSVVEDYVRAGSYQIRVMVTYHHVVLGEVDPNESRTHIAEGMLDNTRIALCDMVKGLDKLCDDVEAAAGLRPRR